MKRDKIKEKKPSQGQEDDQEQKVFFNMHIMTKKDSNQILFVEEIEFLVQTLVLQVDDEFIGYVYRFAEVLDSSRKNVHDIFKNKANFSLEFIPEDIP